jgi:hypothetical protein
VWVQSDELRPATRQEIKATTVLGMAIEEGSAKVRTGWPHDDEEDYSWPVWAGVVPVQAVVQPLIGKVEVPFGGASGMASDLLARISGNARGCRGTADAA